MIVRKNLDPKIVLRVSWKRMLSILLLSVIVYLVHIHLWMDVNISSLPASILGVAIAFLVGFRVNAAYDRWWEGRRVWGAIVNDSRSFARRILSFIRPLHKEGVADKEIRQVQRELIYRHLAFVHAVRLHLRQQDVAKGVLQFIDAEEMQWLSRQHHIPKALMQVQGRRLQELSEKGFMDDYRLMQLDNSLNALTDSLGACERIKNTVFPRQYSLYTTLFIRIYSYMLPFVLVSDTGIMVIPFSLIISFIFFALDSIANGIEKPFENSLNDTPMSALSINIERDLREMLGESELPEKVQPVNGFLF